MTYKQAQELNAQVRKGERERWSSTPAPSAAPSTMARGARGEDTERRFGFLKGYMVFNVEQIEGLPAHYTACEVTRYPSPMPWLDR